MWGRGVLLLALAVCTVGGAKAGGLSHQPLPKHTPGWNESPTDWSPDGRRIVYQRIFEPLPQEAPPHLVELGVVDVEGARSRRLVHQPRVDYEVWDFAGVWSPDGKTIAFTRELGLEGSELYVVASSGGAALEVTPRENTPDLEFGAEWSPDSRLIAFRRRNNQDASREGLWITRPDGTGRVQLTHGDDAGPLWSPDGSLIAFTRRVVGDRGDEIYTVRPDGSELRRVAAADNDLADWSPDSAAILFERGSSIWSMRRDGTDKRRLVEGGSASWSPDGTKLLFARGIATREGRSNGLFVADREGRNARLIFRGAEVGILSPDGTRVAAGASGNCIGSGVYVIRIADRSVRRLTNDCRIRGTNRGDRLRGNRERNVIEGLRGNDVIDANPGDRKIVFYRRFDDDVVIAGPGHDRVFGRRGRDYLDGGPGRDYLNGGIAGDVVQARDGERDVIVCGLGSRDRVSADRLDSVASDCELVRYR
jgi:dipeptidyl aminopeptidase/acylaminoacyl peptidase